MKHFAIIYDSKTGTTKQAAAWIAEGMQAAGDADAKCFSIPDVDLAFVRDADGVILGVFQNRLNLVDTLPREQFSQLLFK